MPDRPLVIYLLPTHQQSDLSTADVATFLVCGRWSTTFFDRSALLTLAEQLRVACLAHCGLLLKEDEVSLSPKSCLQHLQPGRAPTFCSLMGSTSARKGMTCFSETTFMAMPKASNEASLTVGSVSLIVCKWHSGVLNWVGNHKILMVTLNCKLH